MIKNIVFDLGKVLINWDPRNLYRKVFAEEAEMESFLENVCTDTWNEQQDAGRTIEEANQKLIAIHPKYQEEIELFYGRWIEMLDGAIDENVELMRKLKSSHPVYALTNWSAETMPWAWPLFPFLEEFHGMVISGVEKVKKPDPAIYQILFDRFQLVPEESVFIDDNIANIETCRKLGMVGIHYLPGVDVAAELIKLGVKI